MNKRKKIFANKMHRNIFLLVLMAVSSPTIIVTIVLYYLIFNITASQFAIPESIAYNIIPAARKVIIILLALAPVYISVMLIFVYRITHAIIGPFDRIINELGERLKNGGGQHITIRKNDKFWPLVSLINKLLDKAYLGQPRTKED
ncbi:MAG: hypothetical protein ABH952_06000 [Candidatus Omnitrophota bacterium]